MTTGLRAGVPRGCLVLGALLVLWIAAPAAHAGQWIQVSCTNPNGSSSDGQGWSGSAVDDASGAGPGEGSYVYSTCDAGSPLTAALTTQNPTPATASEQLTYTPPAGSALIGGTVQINALAIGGSSTASANVYMYVPGNAYPNDVFYQCTEALGPCSPQGHQYSGPVSIPANTGGDLYIQAECGGDVNGTCDSAPSGNIMSSVQVTSATLLLSNASDPTGAGFSGTILDRRARGDVQLLFTAGDPSGPGVYSVSASVDGTPVYSGTPNTENGSCAAVGSVGATLMFDGQQPCPQTTSVDVPIDTAGLADGRHELTVTVTDAAGNVSTVLDRTISTFNPTPTPVASSGVRTRFELGWDWRGARTRLHSATFRDLPAHAHVSLACAGRHCPRLRARDASGARALRRLLRATERVRFHAGDRLLITVSAPHRRAERIRLTIRDGRAPAGTLLGSRRTDGHRGHRR